MIEAKDLADYLDEVERKNPEVAHSRLETGKVLSTHAWRSSFAYRVDDSEIHRSLGHYDSFGDFLLELNSRVNGIISPGAILTNYFPPGIGVCDITAILRDGLGACLEKSILTQLRAQESGRSHLVKGLLDCPGYGTMLHAFNVRHANGEVLLADAQNPLSGNVDGKKVLYPFDFPLAGFDEESLRFVFQHEENMRWRYHLPFNIIRI